MSEQKSFYDRLFAGRIVWAMHTAMTCDLAYVSELKNKQQGDQISYEAPQCAFFYDANKQQYPPPCTTSSPKFSVNSLLRYVFKLKGSQTHHAKISLICYGENKYRLAVYSRNLTFGSNIDAAMIFELEVGNSSTASGRQLCAYLEKLYDFADENGKKWLDKFPKYDINTLMTVTLKSEFGRAAEIYFGGCDKDTNLGSLIGLDQVSNDSIVLTPPIFIPETAKNFFTKTKTILYDHKENPSHIKLYLLKKTKNKYELWVGSANATPHGLGWNFENQKPNQNASIECLVKFDINEEKFKSLSDNIQKQYKIYADFDEQSHFEFTPDEIGPYIVNNFECCNEVKYINKDKKIEFTLKLKESGTSNANAPDLSKVQWRPLEYSKYISEDFKNLNNDEITLTYDYEEFKAAQGFLVFGTSCCMMDIRGKLTSKIEQVKNESYKKDTRLTDWLLNRETIPSESDKWSDQLKWIRGAISGSKTALPDSSEESKAKPMAFQISGANRLHEILKNNSRAFLADEPGLGKTFTAAMLIDKMAKNYYKDKANKNKHFYVIYVAPNKTLISKCGDDLVKKFNAVSERKAILLSDLASPKENLKRAYASFYEKLTNKRDYEKVKVMEMIEKNFQDCEFDNSRTTLAAIVTKIKVEFKKQHQDLHLSPPSWAILYDYYAKAKAAIPDRLAYAHKILQNSGNIGEKVVIIGVSAELSLGEISNPNNDEDEIIKKFNKSDRAEFTKAFLGTYLPKLIIWDEYHRYFDKLKNGDATFFTFEKISDMKSLFVSATPYKTNISGDEDKKALENLYQLSKNKDSNESLDESPDVQLPSFEKFVKLFCEGTPEINSEDVEEAYNKMTNQRDKNDFESYMKMRMIRNERTRLQGYYEEHIPLYDRKNQYNGVHAEILENTAKQCKLLKAAGYSEGALKWSLSLPWILCFSTSRTDSEYTKNGKKEYTYFERLKLNPKYTTLSDDLFVYDYSGLPKDSLKTLPSQNLAMYQICEKNLPDRQAAQLLWIPPTIPLYKSGNDSIFTKYADYSKLLVFAEFRYLQRGGSLLLSDYTRLLCKTKEHIPAEEFKLEVKDIEDFDFLTGDYRNQILDDLLNKIPGDNTVTKLYQLASPAACAKKLKLKPDELTEAFNVYFNSAGVKEALWSWLCDKGFNEKEKWEEGILRYCAEGNLYAVLEEWLLCIKESDPDKQIEHISSILRRKPSKVGIQTLETTLAKTNEEKNGIPRNCGFAEQLTGDVGDVGSGEDEEATRCCSQAFDSPFYPMILFAGKGAQEGIDLHNYCLRIMHLTLPRGAVSYEQRNGRIDRYRSLLVRRRLAEFVENMQINNSFNLIARAFAYLEHKQNEYPKNNLYPNWSIHNPNSKWHFEELMPVWEYTEESCFADTIIEMYQSYRNSLGVNKSNDNTHIDLSTISEDTVTL